MAIDTINDLILRRDELLQRVSPINNRIRELEAQIGRLESEQWIREYGATLAETQLSVGDDVPYCGSVWDFARWMLLQPRRKPFCEWNEILYLTSDITNGRFENNAPGRLRDLK